MKRDIKLREQENKRLYEQLFSIGDVRRTRRMPDSARWARIRQNDSLLRVNREEKKDLVNVHYALHTFNMGSEDSLKRWQKHLFELMAQRIHGLQSVSLWAALKIPCGKAGLKHELARIDHLFQQSDSIKVLVKDEVTAGVRAREHAMRKVQKGIQRVTARSRSIIRSNKRLSIQNRGENKAFAQELRSLVKQNRRIQSELMWRMAADNLYQKPLLKEQKMIQKEIELIEKFMALEQSRYEKELGKSQAAFPPLE